MHKNIANVSQKENDDGASGTAEMSVTCNVTDWNSQTDVNQAWDVEETILLPGKFTVNSSGKQVQFTKGNLYCNTTVSPMEFDVYESQIQYSLQNLTQYSGEYATYDGFWPNPGYVADRTHIDGFFWESTAELACAETCSNNNFPSGHLFCDGSDENHMLTIRGTSGLYCMSSDEWDYIIKTRTNASQKRKYPVTVAGEEKCLVFAPDDFTGTINSSYSSSEWKIAEQNGLIALPRASFRCVSYYIEYDPDDPYESDIIDLWDLFLVSKGYRYHTSTPNQPHMIMDTNPWCASGPVYEGYSIRLVKIAE